LKEAAMLILGQDLVVDYPVIDADAHVNEPPDLWLERVPGHLRERAPQVEKDDEGGDAWVFDRGKQRRPVGVSALAGLSYVQYKSSGISYETMRPGSFDPAERLKDMDLDGIHAQVLYPSVTLNGASVYSEEPELQVACVRAYNDWLAEFCAYAPERLYGQGIIPTVGVEAAVAELERVMRLGHRGAIISRWPNGSYDPSAEDDRFFATAEAADFPVHIHIGSFRREASRYGLNDGRFFIGSASATRIGMGAIPIVHQFFFSGVLDRFPKLKVVLVESNIGWIPSVLEQTDDTFLRYRFWTHAEDMKLLPSEYFYRNMWATFMIDTVGLALRHKCGLDHIMWSTDYPHVATDWPNSRVVLERNFRDLPYDEVRKMIHENARGLYKMNIADTLDAESVPFGAAGPSTTTQILASMGSTPGR
jgi:predicted TIM-barrel fold metal-dependent hydrolase